MPLIALTILSCTSGKVPACIPVARVASAYISHSVLRSTRRKPQSYVQVGRRRFKLRIFPVRLRPSPDSDPLITHQNAPRTETLSSSNMYKYNVSYNSVLNRIDLPFRHLSVLPTSTFNPREESPSPSNDGSLT
jgi:hypothetical protein